MRLEPDFFSELFLILKIPLKIVFTAFLNIPFKSAIFFLDLAGNFVALFYSLQTTNMTSIELLNRYRGLSFPLATLASLFFCLLLDIRYTRQFRCFFHCCRFIQNFSSLGYERLIWRLPHRNLVAWVVTLVVFSGFTSFFLNQGRWIARDAFNFCGLHLASLVCDSLIEICVAIRWRENTVSVFARVRKLSLIFIT